MYGQEGEHTDSKSGSATVEQMASRKVPITVPESCLGSDYVHIQHHILQEVGAMLTGLITRVDKMRKSTDCFSRCGGLNKNDPQ